MKAASNCDVRLQLIFGAAPCAKPPLDDYPIRRFHKAEHLRLDIEDIVKALPQWIVRKRWAPISYLLKLPTLLIPGKGRNASQIDVR